MNIEASHTEYRGAIHIHSRYSDGSGSVKTIVAAARRTGLDFIIITDHDTVRAKREGWEGWHDGVLVMVGVEISPPGGGHCLAWGVRHCAGIKTKAPREYLGIIGDQCGEAFLAHPQGKDTPFLRGRIERWADWDLDTFAGIEAWSYMHNWVEGLGFKNFVRAMRRPEERITGPTVEVLRHWDEIGRRRRLVGIAGLDVHAQRLPLTWLRIFSYDYLFRTLRTHILTPPFTGRYEEDQRLLREALRTGRCFMADDLPADSTGFVFRGVKADGSVISMGAEVPWQSGVEIEVATPHKAKIGLVHDGRLLCSHVGQRLVGHAPAPGVYRAEVFLEGRPWVFSNPLYLR